MQNKIKVAEAQLMADAIARHGAGVLRPVPSRRYWERCFEYYPDIDGGNVLTLWYHVMSVDPDKESTCIEMITLTE